MFLTPKAKKKLGRFQGWNKLVGIVIVSGRNQCQVGNLGRRLPVVIQPGSEQPNRLYPIHPLHVVVQKTRTGNDLVLLQKLHILGQPDVVLHEADVPDSQGRDRTGRPDHFWADDGVSLADQRHTPGDLLGRHRLRIPPDFEWLRAHDSGKIAQFVGQAAEAV